MRGHSAPCAGLANAIGYVGERLKAFGTAFIICLRCAIRYLDFMGKKKKRGRPRIHTAEYWREYAGITRENNANGVLPTPEPGQGESKGNGVNNGARTSHPV